MLLTTNNAERMRIDSSGNVIVGGTSYSGQGTSIAHPDNSGNFSIFSGSGTGYQWRFGNVSNGVVGSITTSTSGTTYNTTSDLRLKTDIEPIDHATDMLMAMNPVSHRWKAEPDADAVVGFIAQEMQEIVPEAVSKGDSEDDMWSMDYGRITPVLVAALQDAHKKIEELEARINKMEAE
jgi:hypothetical protein